MNDPNWTDVASAIAAVLTPLLLAWVGFLLTRRQSRNDLLLKARFESYGLLAPDLNRLMCYLTFIGSWRDESPVEIVALKRRLDANFHVAAPLFSSGVNDAYRALMDLSFSTFGYWGQDAVIKSAAYRRRQSWRRADVKWDAEWGEMFEIADSGTVLGETLTAYRVEYDGLLAKLVNDLSVTRARKEYTTPSVSQNASAPARADIEGAPRS
jgi:hypothetical protein